MYNIMIVLLLLKAIKESYKLWRRWSMWDLEGKNRLDYYSWAPSSLEWSLYCWVKLQELVSLLGLLDQLGHNDMRIIISTNSFTHLEHKVVVLLAISFDNLSNWLEYRIVASSCLYQLTPRIVHKVTLSGRFHLTFVTQM